jgi:hypothetical protein
MKRYFIARSNESFREAIGNNPAGYISHDEAVQDTLVHEKVGSEFKVICDGLAVYSHFRIQVVGSKKTAVRITTSALMGIEMKRDEDKTEADLLFELVSAIKSQTSVRLSIKAQDAFNSAAARMGVDCNLRQ